MKQRKAAKPESERDKLRQFQQLDDDFARALQDLDDPQSADDIPTGPPVRSLAAMEEDDSAARAETARHQAFSRQVETLLSDYQVSHAGLKALIDTLMANGLWQDEGPAA